MTVTVVLLYFLLLLFVSRLTARRSNNMTFFRAGRQSPWYVVAFGMIGASVSGISFVSVPGMVLRSGMTYLQTCMGFILGYVVVAFVLLPIYYRLNLTTIYSYLSPLGNGAYKTGAAFFVISKLLGAAARFYVPCYILAPLLGMPLFLVAVVFVVLIWLYTRRGGIKTLVWTDTLQTLCMLVTLVLIIVTVMQQLHMSVADIPALLTDTAAFFPQGGAEGLSAAPSDLSKVFDFDWTSRQYFLKQFLSGIFIVIVMTGLDQDMMQKNLTCRTMRDAQKDMCTYGLAFLPVNFLFLVLGILLTLLCAQQGIAIPDNPDQLLPLFALGGAHFQLITVLFILGIVSAAFSSADSALTALTTTICVDICQRPDDERLRRRLHVLVALAFIVCIVLFHVFNTTSLIDAIYILCSYTYGPLLGLFAYSMMVQRSGTADSSLFTLHSSLVCLLSPLLCLALDHYVPLLTGYHFGYELLMLNGMLTFCGLWFVSRFAR